MKRFVAIQGLRYQPNGYYTVVDLHSLNTYYKTSNDIKLSIDKMYAEYDNVIYDKRKNLFVVQKNYSVINGDLAILAHCSNMVLIAWADRVRILDKKIFHQLYDWHTINAIDTKGLNREADLFNSKMAMLGNNGIGIFAIDENNAILHVSVSNIKYNLKIPKCVTALEDDIFKHNIDNISGGENVVYIANSSNGGNSTDIDIKNFPKLKVIGNYALIKYKEKNLVLNDFYYIGIGAFDSSMIEELTISGLPPHIGDEAFKDCCNLRKVNISSRLPEIPFGMFKGCRNLTKIRIPDGCKIIHKEAFMECVNLQEVEFNYDLKKLHGASCFINCPKLSTLYLPKDLDVIFDTDFTKLKNLRTIYISKYTFRRNKIKIGPECEIKTY